MPRKTLSKLPEPKHVEWFVLGACKEYFSKCHNGDWLEEYARDTIDVVWGYLRGTKTLDGTCSDFQCTTAHAAKQVFMGTPL